MRKEVRVGKPCRREALPLKRGKITGVRHFYPKSSWERAVQVLRWLKKEFNLPEKLTIEEADHIEKDRYMGEVVQRKDGLVIRLSKRACTTTHDYVTTAIHEAAHVKLFNDGLGFYHGPTFHKIHGEMLDAYDSHGFSDSLAFPFD